MSSEQVRTAVVTGPRRVEIVERAKPALGPGEVRIAVEQCGIGRSDLRLWQTGPGGSTPAPLGREIAGKIVEVSPELRRWRGSKVAAWMPNAGGLASSVTVKASHCVAVGKHSWAFAVQPLGRLVDIAAAAGQFPLAHTAIIGGDFMALLMVKLIRATAGPRSLILASPRPERRDLARRAGATHVIAPDDLPGLVRGVTGRRGADIVYEFTGDDPAITRAAAALSERGRLVLAGRPGADAFFFTPSDGNLQTVNFREDRVLAGMAEAVELLTSEAIQPDVLPIARFPLSHVADAFHAAADSSSKVVVSPMT